MTQEQSKPPEQLEIKFLITASQEVRDIIRDAQHDYGTKTAQKIGKDLVSKTKELLSDNPCLGRLLYEYPEYEKKGIRRYLPHPHYFILYLLNGNTVEIWHVWNNRRDWTTLFED